MPTSRSAVPDELWAAYVVTIRRKAIENGPKLIAAGRAIQQMDFIKNINDPGKAFAAKRKQRLGGFGRGDENLLET